MSILFTDNKGSCNHIVQALLLLGESDQDVTGTEDSPEYTFCDIPDRCFSNVQPIAVKVGNYQAQCLFAERCLFFGRRSSSCFVELFALPSPALR
jgi:hypothetical protein